MKHEAQHIAGGIPAWVATFKWWCKGVKELNPRLATVHTWIEYQDIPKCYDKSELANAIWEQM